MESVRTQLTSLHPDVTPGEEALSKSYEAGRLTLIAVNQQKESPRVAAEGAVAQ